MSDQVLALASGGLKVFPQRDAAGNITGFQWGNATCEFTAAVTQTWQRGSGGRIEAAGSDVTGAPSFDYLIDGQPDSISFDGRCRRLKCATAGGTWIYQYGTVGQLTSAAHASLGSFNYSFDGIGRRTVESNPDPSHPNLTNLLNQTTAWTHSQNKKITVKADPAARVWINGVEVENLSGNKEHDIELAENQPHGWVEWHSLAVLTTLERKFHHHPLPCRRKHRRDLRGSGR